MLDKKDVVLFGEAMEDGLVRHKEKLMNLQ